MSKNVLNEWAEFYRDRRTQIILNTQTFSLPTALLIFSYLQGKPFILPLILYTYLIYGVFSHSAYITFAWKKDPPISIPGQPTREKISPKYPALRLYGVGGMMLSLTMTAVIYIVPTLRQPVDIFFYGTPTPSPTLTFTTTPSFTPTAVPTDRPIYDYQYYMIVYDSSINMDETFHEQKKWLVASNMVVEIINRLHPLAHYGLVAIGGSNPTPASDPCASPSLPAVSFSSRQAIHSFLGGLQPAGGGSFVQAVTVAKHKLQDLPPNTIRTLIYITGTSDSCEGEDEWQELKELMDLPDTSVGLYSQIIILDDDGFRAQSLADQLNSLKITNLNAQAPQSIPETQGGGAVIVNIVNNVQNHVTNVINMIVTPTTTLTATITTTLQPGETRTPPTNTPTRTPTFTVTATKTLTPSLVPPTATSACPPPSHPILTGSGLGGSANIYSPSHCSVGHPPETEISTSGPYSGIPSGAKIWVLVYAPDHLYYPQSPNACGGGLAPIQDGSNWSVNTYLGKTGDPPKWYDILVVVADAGADQAITNWFNSNCPGFQGIGYETISQWNITEKAYVTVQTGE